MELFDVIRSKRGVPFQCIACGHCCSGESEGLVFVYKKEIQQICAYLKISEADFLRNYCDIVDVAYKDGHMPTIVLQMNPTTKNCIFQQDNGTCKIYPARPFQCLSFPFWALNLRNPAAWEKVKAICRGFSATKGMHVYTLDEIKTFLEKERQLEEEHYNSLEQNDFKLSSIYPCLSALTDIGDNNPENFRAIRKQVLQDIRPTPAEIEGLRQVAENLGACIKAHAQKAGVPVSFFEIEGSTGLKQTQLRNASDIDAFVGLPKTFVLAGGRNTKKKGHKDLEQFFAVMVKSWLTDAVKEAGATAVDVSYAEHPYLSAKLGPYDVDVVFCIDLPEAELLNNGPITAMDRTPWHTRYLDRALSPDQKDDVRLLKQFFKACHAYGDASATGQGGFIGYASELLIQHLGSFWNAMKTFPALPKKCFDPFGRNPAQLRKVPRFQNDLLLIIDPTDRNRNVAAAISARAYRWVNARVKAFVTAPSTDFFHINAIPEISNCPPEFKVIEFKAAKEIHYTVIRDKLYSWAASVQKNARNEPGNEPRFEDVNYEIYFQPRAPEYALAFYTKTPGISSTYLRQGPAVRNAGVPSPEDHEPSDVKKFLLKHPNAVEKEGFYWIDQKRDFTEFTTLLIHFLQTRPVADGLNVTNLPHLTPTSHLGRQALYVLREMVLPFEPR